MPPNFTLPPTTIPAFDTIAASDNWRRDQRFMQRLREKRRELWADAAEQLRALVHPALAVLKEQLGARYDRTRYRAAHIVLHLSNLRKCVPLLEDDDDREPRA